MFIQDVFNKYKIHASSEEADALSPAMTKSEIPPEYRELKIIAKGNTIMVPMRMRLT